MITTMRAPNRYRKMNPNYAPFDSEEDAPLHKKDAQNFSVPWHAIPKQKVVVPNNSAFWEEKFRQYPGANNVDDIRKHLQDEIRSLQRIEYPEKGIPLGLGYSFDICDEVLAWSDEPYQFKLGNDMPGFFIIQNEINI